MSVPETPQVRGVLGLGDSCLDRVLNYSICLWTIFSICQRTILETVLGFSTRKYLRWPRVCSGEKL